VTAGAVSTRFRVFWGLSCFVSHACFPHTLELGWASMKIAMEHAGSVDLQMCMKRLCQSLSTVLDSLDSAGRLRLFSFGDSLHNMIIIIVNNVTAIVARYRVSKGFASGCRKEWHALRAVCGCPCP